MIYAGAISAEKKHRIFGETVSASALSVVIANSPEEAIKAVTASCFEKYPEKEWHRHDTMIAVIPESVILNAGYVKPAGVSQ